MKTTRRSFIGGSVALTTVGLLGCGSSETTAPIAPQGGAGPGGGGVGGAGGAGGVGGGEPDAGVDAGPPPQRPDTTVRQRIQGVLPTEQQPVALKAQWGVTQLVPGDAHLRLDELGVDALAGAPTGEPVSLLYAAVLSDVHIIDEESPARTINLDQVASAAWRKQEAHATQVFDAMVRKLHEFDELRSLDLVLITGDCIENNQENELDWFLQVLTGATVVPNSGDVEDPRPGPDNDPHDSFQAVGLGTIPWYLAIGNHDALIQGNLARNPIWGYSLITGDPTRDHIDNLSLGRVNSPVCRAIPADEAQQPDRCIPSSPQQLAAGGLPPDVHRAHLSKAALFEKVLQAPGAPYGHGFGAQNVNSGDGDYVADPVAGLPLRLIVLDTNASLGAEGSYDRVNSFLVPELQQAVLDEVLVIVASHHPSASVGAQGDQIRAALHACPNVVAHLVGHGHKNDVIPRSGATPAEGYWEVQSASLACWPQQARLLELVDNRDGTAELWFTLIDYGTEHQPLGAIAEDSRFLSLQEIHSGAQDGGQTKEGAVEDRNVILPVLVPEAMRQKLASLEGQPIESALFE